MIEATHAIYFLPGQVIAVEHQDAGGADRELVGGKAP
jgi:hypothetical protein